MSAVKWDIIYSVVRLDFLFFIYIHLVLFVSLDASFWKQMSMCHFVLVFHSFIKLKNMYSIP